MIFRKLYLTAIKEFEQETKDLSKKWRELESRKEEFQLRIQKEKDEFKQKMQNSVSQFEEERTAWRKERRQIEEQRQNIHDEFQKMISNRELLHESMKKNQEKKDYIRRDLECKIQALEMQVIREGKQRFLMRIEYSSNNWELRLKKKKIIRRK